MTVLQGLRSIRYVKPNSFLRKCGFSRHISENTKQPRICVIGSGPAGFYTAQYILKHNKEVTVDILEKLPVPFGLVRYGVAPDHPEVKNASNTFEEVATDTRFRYFGNVNVGKDVKAEELRNLYEGIVFCYGADDDKTLNIPGENANGVYAARSFVGWYNGLPAHANLSPDLSCDTAVIIGQGNVALDVARILLAPIKHLQHTDICEHAVEALSKSKLKNVHIIGRRGPLEVSFTIKEVREMTRLPGVKTILHAEDFVHIKSLIPNLPRSKKRLVDLMCKTALDPSDSSAAAKRQWQADFQRSPVHIITDSHNNVCGIKLEKNELIKRDNGSISAIGTNEFEEIPCGMVLRSIGYKSIEIEKGIPFDVKLGIIPNVEGRVVENLTSKNIVKGLYCSGWVKHGPVGVILTTMNEAFSTARSIVDDLKSGNISLSAKTIDIETLLTERGIDYVTFKDYGNIDEEEKMRGKERNKPREKITSETEMLDVAFRKKSIL